MHKAITPAEFTNICSLSADILEIVDLRDEKEYEIIRIRGSKCLPMDEIMWNLEKIDFSKTVILLCRTGRKSARMANYLTGLDKNVIQLTGGIRALWEEDCPLLEAAPHFKPAYLQ